MAGRKEVQARDAFDIFILSIGGHSKDFNPKIIADEVLLNAREALFSINYQDYEGKVLEFLEDMDKPDYSGHGIWKEVQEIVSGLITK